MFTSPRRMQAISELGFEEGFLKQAQALGIPGEIALLTFEKISGKKAEKPEKKAKKPAKPKQDAGPESAAKPASKPAAPAAKAPAPQAPPAALPAPTAPPMPQAPPMGLGGGGGGMGQLSPAEMMILAQLQRSGQLG